MDGDVLNALTRQEWNAAYFIGLERILKGEETGNVAVQVAVGLRELQRSGHHFARLREDSARGLCQAPEVPAEREHDRASREILAGSFDQIGRAREALAWFAETSLADRAGWLHGLVGLYDRIHGGASGERLTRRPPGGAPWRHAGDGCALVEATG
ncbi:MAG: hypothetical protein HY900_30275 [Deltaproteobacteria bacterium]|nr:hypothetical protein [Deltaproteobacteria bacterium]